MSIKSIDLIEPTLLTTAIRRGSELYECLLLHYYHGQSWSATTSSELIQLAVQLVV